ncbi:hypothetical protein [Amycolatopsis sp. NBC_00438]|uniref:hypothetical protein n=1 Tax=Amycolatopsis sp. NBC_00438 TaxID=2903558 RepID=UPI002E1CD3CB
MTDDELAVRLKELTDEPAPPMVLDLDRARRDGGRRRRLRTVTVVAGCAAVVIAGGLTAATLTRAPAPDAPIAAPPPPPVVSVAPPPTDDPLVAKASFGWLPGAFTGVEYGVGAHGDYSLAIGRGDLAPMIWLAVYDKEPPLDRLNQTGGHAVSVPARIGDRTGYWVTTNAEDPLNGGDAYLRWPTGDGRWAELHGYYLDFPDVQRSLVRVADEVTFANKPVPLPLHVSSLPPGFHLSEGQLWRRPDQDGRPWTLQLYYSVNGADVVIEVAPPGGTPSKTNDAVCVTKNGLKACVRVDRPAAAGLDAIGGPQGLLDRITLLGPDEKNWTTHVIG